MSLLYFYDCNGFYTEARIPEYTFEGEAIIPHDATLKEPPVCETKIAWWNGATWELRDDPGWDYKQLLKYETYLTSTDWYAIRYADSGVPIPDEVKTARQKAREEIDRLRVKLNG